MAFLAPQFTFIHFQQISFISFISGIVARKRIFSRLSAFIWAFSASLFGPLRCWPQKNHNRVRGLAFAYDLWLRVRSLTEGRTGLGPAVDRWGTLDGPTYRPPWTGRPWWRSEPRPAPASAPCSAAWFWLSTSWPRRSERERRRGSSKWWVDANAPAEAAGRDRKWRGGAFKVKVRFLQQAITRHLMLKNNLYFILNHHFWCISWEACNQ